MNRVFVSYRRRDTAHQANSLKSLIEHRLDGVKVFVDSASIPPGQHWGDRLATELDQAAAVVVLVGPGWRHRDGVDLLTDEGDWVRIEVAEALRSKRGNVLPVFVENAVDQLHGLPPAVAGLADLQGSIWRTENWVDDSSRIVSWVAGVVGATQSVQQQWPKPDDVKAAFPSLTDEQIGTILDSGAVDGWSMRPTVVDDQEGNELYKSFEFEDFRRAFTFMKLAAVQAERFGHHPEWTNAWNLVRIRQRTWDVGHKVTSLDFQMASHYNLVSEECRKAETVTWPSTF